MDKKKYPIGPENYTLYEEVGQGVSASVHRALCKPFNEIVAIKILDFERGNCDLVLPCFQRIVEISIKVFLFVFLIIICFWNFLRL
jgi:hypothetical protein